jgi:large subunit ribosomal protein L9
MKVILLGELRGKGGEGDVVDVAQGYAENYLFPNRLAIKATPGNLKQLEERRHNIAKREEKRIADAETAKAVLDGKTVKVDVRVGEEGQLFGSVTSQMVADAIKDQLGLEIDRRRVERNATIKTAGTHQVTVNLYREINATVYVVVGDVTEPEPAEEAPAEEGEAPEEAAEAPTEEAGQAEAEEAAAE